MSIVEALDQTIERQKEEIEQLKSQVRSSCLGCESLSERLSNMTSQRDEAKDLYETYYIDRENQIKSLRTQLAEAQRERDEARNEQGMEYGANQDREREIASLSAKLQSQTEQLAKIQAELDYSQEQLDSAKYQSRLMSVAEHKRLLDEIKSQAAQLAGMRGVLNSVLFQFQHNMGLDSESVEENEKIEHKILALCAASDTLKIRELTEEINMVLHTPASDYEKRVQELVEALEEIKEMSVTSERAQRKNGLFRDWKDISRDALAAWEGKK